MAARKTAKRPERARVSAEAPEERLEQDQGPSEPTEPPRPVAPHEQYNRVVAQAQLRVIRLLSCSFVMRPLIDAVGKTQEFFLDRELVHCGLDESEAGVAHALFRWETRVEVDAENALVAKCDYLVQYEGLTNCSEAAVRAFIERVGTMASYPYFRALVSQLNWAALADLPPLPVITTESFAQQDAQRNEMRREATKQKTATDQ